MTRADVLITAAELTQHLAAGRPMAILDVRWQLTEPDGRDAYHRGHLPGAIHVSLEDDLTDHTVSGRGRHPLPSGKAVEAAARRWGVRDGVPTVVYDDWNRAGSARAWWVLTAAGIKGVRILDGGLAAWKRGGGVLETGTATAQPGDVTVAHDDLYAGALPTITADEIASFGGVVIDARAPERYRGDSEPVDPVSGHIPGARNAPSTEALTPDGTFRPDDDLRQIVAEGGAQGVAAYCGSGVTAAVAVAALRVAGIKARLFPGSWSQWCSDPSRPVDSGP